MTRGFVLLFVLLLLQVSCIIIVTPVWASGDSWASRAPMQEARAGLGVTVVNGNIYAIGGSTESGLWSNVPTSIVFGNTDIDEFVGTNEEYDPVTNMWTFKTPMPTPRGVFAIAVYKNKIYCIGGKTNEGISRVNEVYDPATDTWETKASMPATTFQVQANVVGDKIYVVDPSGPNYVYDPTLDTWTTKTSMPHEAFTYASTVVDNRIYFIGGFSSNVASNMNQIYDTETDSWSLGTPSLSTVTGGSAGTITGVMAPERIYVFGKPVPVSQDDPLFYNQVYDPENDSWTIGSSVPTKRVNFGVAIINDKLYVIGGHTYDIIGFIEPSRANELYTPIGYIPEFPSWIILPLFLVVTSFAMFMKKKAHPKVKRIDN